MRRSSPRSGRGRGRQRYPNDTYSIGTGELRAYCYVMAREYENIDWWRPPERRCSAATSVRRVGYNIGENIGRRRFLDEAERAEWRRSIISATRCSARRNCEQR
ncbi:MAG: hypothetical protein ACLRSW_12775 [Christensenellaceae bacterium]